MKVLIVDDHDVVRKGIAAMLECDEDFSEIEEAGSLDEGMKKLTVYMPDIALIDVNLAGKNGLDIIEQARKSQVETKFVVLTSSSRKGDFLRAKELDVDGYILKDSNVEDIIYAIKSIARGRKFYDTQIAERSSQDDREKVLSCLTEREREVFIEIGKGLTNTQIAEKLYISENTVKKHISSLLSKLGLAHRTEVALYATKLWRRSGELGK